MYLHKEKRKKLLDGINRLYFPSEEWNYNEWQKNPTSNNLGISKNVTDEDILNILNKFGFVNFKADKTNVVDAEKPLTDKDLEGINISKSQIEEILDFFQSHLKIKYQ